MKYDINSIESLTFREGVRQRIQMYLGSDDIEGAYQGLKEIINNSTDEAIAGYGKKIEIEYFPKTNGITVRDYGRGVPFGIRDNGENVLVSIYTKSHTGGKFGHDSYKNASGLNGVGGSCVCLSSSWFSVISYRDGKKAQADFIKGELANYTEGDTTEPNGTFVKFSPDPEVFKNGDITYDFERICNDIKNISYLYNGIAFICKCGADKRTYLAKNGIMDFVRDNLEKPLHNHIISGRATDGIDTVEIAFQWGSKNESNHVFVNGLLCPEGGSPITGAKTSITKVFNNLAKSKFDGDSIRHNLFYVINCTVENPSFANQTKSKINNASLRTLTSNAFTSAIKEMATKYRSEFETIVEMLKKIERAEAAAEKARQNVLNASREVEQAGKEKVFDVKKLSDAEKLGEDAILLCVEGKSAASNIRKARDPKKYGLLQLRGKVINALSNDLDDVLKNEEVMLLLKATGINIKDYSKSKLRYGRIGICVDADDDGGHIACLLMALLYRLAPQFIKENRLVWLHAPLYRVTKGGKQYYYYSDEELAKGVKGEQIHFKGLGEMNDTTDNKIMFAPETQKLETLTWDENFAIMIENLMGEDSEPKRDFIFSRIDFEKYGEF